jgi:hypothetical protein
MNNIPRVQGFIVNQPNSSNKRKRNGPVTVAISNADMNRITRIVNRRAPRSPLRNYIMNMVVSFIVNNPWVMDTINAVGGNANARYRVIDGIYTYLFG